MRDIGHEVTARGLKFLNLCYVTAQQKALALAVGHNLNLKNLTNLRDILKNQRLRPVFLLKVARKLRMAKQIHNVAAEVHVTLQANMLLRLLTGVGNLIVGVER